MDSGSGARPPKRYWSSFMVCMQADSIVVVSARLISIPGGGFAFPANDGHLKFLSSIMDSMRSRGRPLSVLMVDYPLTPLANFPTQFQESVSAVRYVVETCNYQPSQIILGGDSAGGNLAASVILHCLQPSEHVLPLRVVTQKSKFKGLVLVSPWVSFDITLASFTREPNKDYIQAESEKRWSDIYLSKGEPCIYNEPGLAPAALWKDMPVQDVLVTAGADEALIDGITKWVEVHNTNVMYNIAQHEPHEAPIIWSAFGDQHVTETERKVEAWLQSLFEKIPDA
ncbi:uncharacterized protein A1O9_07195 [Exophiala aquamarina CBS 119918]|uniref:Alpha/beta hydrolase fold-3 domain-containing protein n=1 Tax=Exophiala aquamarina CBS 119918 TaxID=1182545 RepID=A0A072PN87_9EURO|nr:uncharacterized protein A1O9_07195 [Exophiala aquamarina CBS 119918]KEF57005.1 hypothetical protein A1O9_07195 [Exophiala aquamarina CBS 119918]